MQIIADGNQWQCVGVPKNKTEKKIKKNADTIQRQLYWNMTKEMFRLGHLTNVDVTRIKRMVFSGEKLE